MVHEVQGVISRRKDAPVELTTILVPDPGPGEASCVQACGVCHTDLHYKLGGIGDDYPYLLGHEAAGYVAEAVGAGVTDVAPGDYVILNWRAVCGSCRACRRGRPWPRFAQLVRLPCQRLDVGRRQQPGDRLVERRRARGEK